MTNKFIRPDLASISDLLQMFLGDELTVAESDASDLSNRFIATYVNDNDDLVALCACDLQFVAYAGAALSMVPVGAANDAIGERNVTTVMADNFHEVMNIFSKLLMSDSSSHLRLARTLPPEETADVIASLQSDAEPNIGFSVGIPGYGDGSVVFLIS